MNAGRVRGVIRAGALLVVGILGCRTPSPTATTQPEAAASVTASVTPAVSVTPVASSASSSPAAHRADGCWGLDLPSDRQALLSQLGQRCAHGLKPLFPEPRALTLSSEGAQLDLPALPAGACLRVALSVGSTATLSLLDAQGHPLATATSADFVLLDDAGPVCPRRGEGLRLAVRGQGAGLVQAWSSGR